MSKPTVDEMLWVDRLDAAMQASMRTSSPHLLRHFHNFTRNGFTVVQSAVDPALCDRVVAAYKAWFRDRPELGYDALRPDGFHKRLVNFHLASPEARELFLSPKALAVQDFLFGYPASVYSSLYFECGTRQPIHLDLPYFLTVPENHYFGVWYALEDANEENGALMVVRGGHRLPKIDSFAIADRRYGVGYGPLSNTDTSLWVDYQNELQRLIESHGLQVEQVPVRKGDVLIWHPLLPHGGGPVRQAGRTRHSMVIHTVPDQVPVYQAEVFFDRNAVRSENVRWKYQEYEGRRFADHGAPSIGDN